MPAQDPLEQRFIEHLDSLVECYGATILAGRNALKEKAFDLLRGFADLRKAPPGRTNMINPEGSEHLEEAGELLLKLTGETERLTLSKAKDAIVVAFFAELDRMKETSLYSAEAILRNAREGVRAIPRQDGLYVFPAQFAPSAKESSFHAGPVRLVSKDRFQREHKDALEKEATDEPQSMRPLLLEDWNNFLVGYDHLITVDVKGYEESLAWQVAEEGAEFFLNLIRMRFRFEHTKNIRLSLGLAPQDKRSSLRISRDGEFWFTSHRDYGRTMLDDRWSPRFEEDLRNFQLGIAIYLGWLLSGSMADAPVMERLRYANGLISEAYSQPHEPVRLVRIIAALETLALVADRDKAEALATRCKLAGGWTDTAKADAIYAAVKEAYKWRNKVVHGDAPDRRTIRRAFLRVEQHLLEIFLGFLTLFVRIERATQPRSTAALRQELTARLEPFFQDPSHH